MTGYEREFAEKTEAAQAGIGEAVRYRCCLRQRVARRLRRPGRQRGQEFRAGLHARGRGNGGDAESAESGTLGQRYFPEIRFALCMRRAQLNGHGVDHAKT